MLMEPTLVDFSDCELMHSQPATIMKFNRSLEPNDDCGDDPRSYNNEHDAEPAMEVTVGARFSPDLL